MSKTALFFSPEGGSVNKVSIQLGNLIGIEKTDIIPATKVVKDDLQKYTQIIFLGSTVGADHWVNEMAEDEWQGFFKKIEDVDFADKKVAIVGLGNSVLYPEHFADGMATLYKILEGKNANIFGSVDADDYEFTDSEALNDDGLFCGLPIDEDNEDDLTVERLEKWVALLKTDFEF